MAKPILKWAGSKRAIVPVLQAHMPETYGDYWEPFLGGASLFLSLFPINGKRAHLSDLNDDLITVYTAIRDDADAVMAAADKLNEDWTEEAYYAVRAQHDLTDPVERAARFPYLNKYGYNGLARYNKSGRYNVPWGHKKKQVMLYDPDNIRDAASAFAIADLDTASYDSIKPAAGDFVYFDPPYHSTFNDYQKGGFGEDGQQALADFCRRLDDAGVLFMASNSYNDYICGLYDGFDITVIDAPRYISCRSDGRKPTQEVLIRNYA